MGRQQRRWHPYRIGGGLLGWIQLGQWWRGHTDVKRGRTPFDGRKKGRTRFIE